MKIFQLQVNKSTARREILAGCTSFSTLAYATFVVPLILQTAGLDFTSSMLATIFSAVIGTILMGLFGNYPFVIFPGIGMATYFTYSVVLKHHIEWQVGLGILFLISCLMLILWATGLRAKIVYAIPRCLKIGTTAGIGLFLVIVALQRMNIVIADPQTVITLGNITARETLLFAFGVVLITALLSRKIQGAILMGIIATWLIGLLAGHAKWEGIVSWPHFSLDTFFALDIKKAFSWEFIPVIFSFLIVYLFDTSGSILGLAEQGRFYDKKGRLPRMSSALFPDSAGSMAAALFGSAGTVLYVESAAGIAEGGRTGLTAIVAGLLLLLLVFFAPFISSIPLFAVMPALVIVGALMIRNLAEMKWDDPSDFIPCYIIVFGIPFSFSIGVGIGLGVLFYPLCKLLAGKWRDVTWLAWLLAILFAVKFALD